LLDREKTQLPSARETKFCISSSKSESESANFG